MKIGSSGIVEQNVVPAIALLCVWTAASALSLFYGWTKDKAGIAVKALKVSAIAMIVLSIFKPFGAFGNPTVLATWLALNIPLFGQVAGAIILLWMIKLKALTALAAGLSVILLKKPGQKFLAVLLIGFAACIAITHPSGGFINSLRWRLDFWEKIINVFGITWFGSGLGAVLDTFKTHAHNDYLEILIAFGVVGFALFIGVATDLLIRVMRLREDSRQLYGGIVLASCLCATTQFTWFFAATGILVLFAIGRIYAETTR